VPLAVALTEKDFQTRAFPELKALVEALDVVPDVSAELGGDVLTIEFEDQKTYVVNTHLAARQIWLAAERSAWHFDYTAEAGRWVDRKSGAELWETLRGVLSRKLGTPVALERP
jgi:CyaY protein